MMKFVLTGYRHPDIDKNKLFDHPLEFGSYSYPVYEVEYISDDLIFGRD